MKAYTFKEITDKKELEQFFRFRYEIYSGSENKAFIKENTQQLDIDYFDIHARHYCLMNEINRVGYFRVIFQKDEFANEQVIEIGEKFSLLKRAEHFQENGNAPFPFLSYEGVPNSHWAFYNNLLNKNEKMAEASRIIISPEYRAVRTIKLLIECAIVLYALHYITLKYAIVNCDLLHGLFYTHYGFKEIDDAGRYIVNGLNKTSLSLSEIPEKYNDTFEAMAEEFKLTGKIEREI